MTTTTQAALQLGAPQPDPPTSKVLIPRQALLDYAAMCERQGFKQKANAIRTGCMGYREDATVPVSRGLAERWGLHE